jgi:hypothetical protein
VSRVRLPALEKPHRPGRHGLAASRWDLWTRGRRWVTELRARWRAHRDELALREQLETDRDWDRWFDAWDEDYGDDPDPPCAWRDPDYRRPQLIDGAKISRLR